jgi:catechol 2,3-dioxygenase-like lactoylglutathione lyase family enzyme
MKPKISLVTLGVEDLDRSIEFYRDGLGFPVQSREPDSEIAFCKLEGTELALYPRSKLAEDATVPNTEPGFSGVTLAHNVPSKRKVDEIISTAKTAGARVVKTPGETFWGGYSGYFADPDEHLWEVAYPEFGSE